MRLFIKGFLMRDELKKHKNEYLSLNLNNNINYEKFSMISIVYNSTQIEGCSLDESDTRLLIENNITAKGKPLNDHLMVKDHYETFLFIKSQALKKRKLSVGFLTELTAKVMENTDGLVNTISGEFDTSKGDLRLAQVYVDHKYFPDFSKVPALLEKLCKTVNEKLDLVEGV